MNKYDVLKSIGQVILPAILTCMLTILKTLNIPHTSEIEIIAMAILTCYNSIIVVWNKTYYQKLTKDTEETGAKL